MGQLENIEAIEKRLWSVADTLRANSNYASNQYFMPVMGLVFLRHAYSRYLAVKDEIIAGLPTRGGKTPELTKKDFSKKSAIFLQPKAQFDYLVALKDSDDRANAVIDAMESIEGDYETLRGVLPTKEYRELDNEILGQLLRALNPEELKKVSGDVFGRIYEYFLTQFADQKAHDGGEFFTPVSLVSLIANVLEPKKGTVLDPACGSGGMFVQSARFVENLHQNPNDKLSFYGLEKNGTTIDLAKMNLAVHGLVGDIKKAISYYEDPHDLYKKADFVMANPPFNVDEIDADKIKNDPRLPFGLPGVNNKGKVSNGNYVWISYFYSYLTQAGRAGFMMSSQASSAGNQESKVRQKLIETGDVDIMISIRSNFFYTRTVSCELWFFNKSKPAEHKDKVLMIDARNIFRKVTRKIYDFSPEQLQNILSIIWLYRGETGRFHNLVNHYRTQMFKEDMEAKPAVEAYLDKCLEAGELRATYKKYIVAEGDDLSLLAKKLQKLIDDDFRMMAKVAEGDGSREKQRMLKEVESLKQHAVSQLKLVSYFHHQAEWLIERFPEGKLRDVEGLVKLV
ncbi:type I restriction-modification system subunit M, partial [bacterium]|nr:type I restriction-modification system subunit M [bacterium]